MAEITPAELRRLQQLDQRISRVTDDRDALRSARNELRGQVKALQGEARQKERELKATERRLLDETAETTAKLQALIAENQDQAQALEQAQADAEVVGTQAEKLRAELSQQAKQVENLTQSNKELTQRVKQLEVDGKQQAKALAIARSQLEDQDKVIVLGPDEVGGLVDDFIGRVGGGRRLVVDGGRVQLKVAFGGTGAGAGFVLPSATGKPNDLGELHEITVDLRRRPTVEAAGAAETLQERPQRPSRPGRPGTPGGPRVPRPRA